MPQIVKISPRLVKISYTFAIVVEIILREQIRPGPPPISLLFRMWQAVLNGRSINDTRLPVTAPPRAAYSS